jgi:hypothetical protein
MRVGHNFAVSESILRQGGFRSAPSPRLRGEVRPPSLNLAPMGTSPTTTREKGRCRVRCQTNGNARARLATRPARPMDGEFRFAAAAGHRPRKGHRANANYQLRTLAKSLQDEPGGAGLGTRGHRMEMVRARRRELEPQPEHPSARLVVPMSVNHLPDLTLPMHCGRHNRNRNSQKRQSA